MWFEPGSGQIDPTSVLDLAIGVEEEEALRYAELALAVRDPETSRILSDLGARESEHRRRLESRRDFLLRHRPRRFDMSLRDEPRPPRATVAAHDALALSERAERRAIVFYSTLLPRLEDGELRQCITELRRDAIEHRRVLQDQLALCTKR